MDNISRVNPNVWKLLVALLAVDAVGLLLALFLPGLKAASGSELPIAWELVAVLGVRLGMDFLAIDWLARGVWWHLRPYAVLNLVVLVACVFGAARSWNLYSANPLACAGVSRNVSLADARTLSKAIEEICDRVPEEAGFDAATAVSLRPCGRSESRWSGHEPSSPCKHRSRSAHFTPSSSVQLVVGTGIVRSALGFALSTNRCKHAEIIAYQCSDYAARTQVDGLRRNIVNASRKAKTSSADRSIARNSSYS